jgi:hypothetical protein
MTTSTLANCHAASPCVDAGLLPLGLLARLKEIKARKPVSSLADSSHDGHYSEFL